MKDFTNELRKKIASEFSETPGETVGFYEKNYGKKMDNIKNLFFLK